MRIKPNQQQWTMIDNKSKTHKIMLVHSPKTGHLLIHYNYKEVILYDKEVFKSSKYSFFIDDELCEIHIIRNLQQYAYNFFINKEADTPLNQARKKIDTRDRNYTILFVIGLFSLVGLFVYFSRYLSEQRDREQLEKLFVNYSANATAQIYDIKAQDIAFVFKTEDNRLVDGKLAKCYVPFAIGDTFSLKYITLNPTLYRADTVCFNWITLPNFFERTRLVQQETHPEQDILYINRLLNTAYELHGLEGWKHIFYQKTPEQKGKPYDQNSYGRMVRDTLFERKMRQ